MTSSRWQTRAGEVGTCPRNAVGSTPARPAISVVTPFHNRCGWLRRYLATLERQSFKNFEVIIVDDGSTDGLADAVYSKRTGFPLRFIRLTENRGAGAARNVGMSIARGRYIALLDSDDAWHPDKLARDLARFAGAHDRDRLVGLSRHVVVGTRTFVRPRRLMRPTDRVGPYLFQLGGVIQTSTMVLTADLARAARFAEGEPGHDDWTFALRLEALGARFSMDPEALTCYRDDDRLDRRSPRETRISLEWLDRYRGPLGEDAYLAARAAFGSRMRGAGARSGLPMIMTALLHGAVPAWRSAYYVGAWAVPAVRGLGTAARHIWLAGGIRPPDPAWSCIDAAENEDPSLGPTGQDHSLFIRGIRPPADRAVGVAPDRRPLDESG